MGDACLIIRCNEQYFTLGDSHDSSRRGGGGGRDGFHGFKRELREAQSSLTEYKGGTVEN